MAASLNTRIYTFKIDFCLRRKTTASLTLCMHSFSGCVFLNLREISVQTQLPQTLVRPVSIRLINEPLVGGEIVLI